MCLDFLKRSLQCVKVALRVLRNYSKLKRCLLPLVKLIFSENNTCML